MCGIAGIFSLNDAVVRSAGSLRRMAANMRYRGPDDEGYLLAWKDSRGPQIYAGTDTPRQQMGSASLPFYPEKEIGEADGIEAHLFLGHRRLAILDLSAHGHQPMCSHCGRFWVVYNGEIYNFREVARVLTEEGVQLRGRSDTEVLVNAYALWRERCLEKFNGMFALVIWDDKEKSLFCARDRIGIKPFYYTVQNSKFIFASDIKTIIASGEYSPTPDWQGVYHALSLSCAPRPMTCFQGVQALEPAHWMLLGHDGMIRKHRYWSLPVGVVESGKTEQQWVEDLEATLIRAVQRRLVADVPVGTFMSGGIDSTTVSAVAARLHPGIQAFTLTHGERATDFDELPQAQATAAMYDMRHIVEKAEPDRVLGHLKDIVLCYEEPFPSLGPTYVISQLVSKNNIKVVLNGLGPDEMFCGYGREKWLPFWRMAAHGRSFLRLFSPIGGRFGRLVRVLGSADIATYYVNLFSPFSEKEKQRLFHDSRAQGWDSPRYLTETYGLDQLDFSDGVEAITYLDIINYIGNHHMYRGDQFTMRFSLESRFPFLDHEMVELACRMPATIKSRNGVGKYILRQVARKYIDLSSLAMKKKGFVMPMDQWMRSSLRPLVSDKIASLKERGVFAPEELDKIKRRFDGRKDSYLKLWLLVAVELWLETLIDDQPGRHY